MKNTYIPYEKMKKYEKVRPKYRKQFYYIVSLIMVVVVMLLLIVLNGCTQYTAITPPKPDYTLTLNNQIMGVNLYEYNNQIFLKNVSDKLITKIDYNVNMDNLIIFDVFAPNEEIFLYTWSERPTTNLVIIINSISFY